MIGNVASPTCGYPGMIANGQVYARSGTAVGEKVYYRCNVGFTLKGDSIRTCQKDYTWSGVAPVCTGSYMHTVHTYSDCKFVLWKCLYIGYLHVS